MRNVGKRSKGGSVEDGIGGLFGDVLRAIECGSVSLRSGI